MLTPDQIMALVPAQRCRLAWRWVGCCCFTFPNFRSPWATGFQDVPIKPHSRDLEAGHFWLLVLIAEHTAHCWLDALVSKSGHRDGRARPALSAHAQARALLPGARVCRPRCKGRHQRGLSSDSQRLILPVREESKHS